MNILLIAVGIIFILGFVIGYVRGFIKIIASLAITIATIVLVAMLSPMVSRFLLKHTPIQATVEKHCTQALTDKLAEELTRDEEIALLEGAEMPEFIRNLLIDNNNAEMKEELGVSTFQEYATQYLSKMLADILAFLITFIILTILARILVGVLGLLAKLPVIGGLNRVLGGATGLVFALLIVWIGFVAITLLYQTEIAVTCFEYIEQSTALKWLYDNNILMKMILKG